MYILTTDASKYLRAEELKKYAKKVVHITTKVTSHIILVEKEPHSIASNSLNPNGFNSNDFNRPLIFENALFKTS